MTTAIDTLDRARSTAILVGTTRSADSRIDPVPAASASLRQMRRVLLDPRLCGWPRGRVKVHENASDAEAFKRTLRKALQQAGDVLFFYYVGSVVLLASGRPCFALADTDAAVAEDSGLDYTWVRDAILATPARLKIVILDCSFSGRVIEPFSFVSVADLTAINGAYTMTSADLDAPKHPLPGGTATPFTAELLDLIHTGIPNGSGTLSLGDLYTHLVPRLEARGLPAPNQRGAGMADRAPFTRNAAHPAGTPRQIIKRRAMLIAGLSAATAAAVAAAPTIVHGPDTSGKLEPAASPAIADRPLLALGSTVYGLAFTPDGRSLITGDKNGTIRRWTVETGAVEDAVDGRAGAIYGIQVSPDGRSIAFGANTGAVRLWQGDHVTAMPDGHEFTVWGLAFSPDGRTLASASSDRTVKLWDVARRRLRATLPHPATIAGVTFSPDGRTLATGANDFHIRLWDTRSITQMSTLSGHRGAITRMAFTSDGRTLVSGSWDRTARIWDVRSSRLSATLTGHRNIVHGVALAPDGRTLVTGGDDDSVRLWDLATGTSRSAMATEGPVFDVVFRPHSQTLAFTSGRTVWLREVT
ncbi:WD40 repeat domain-containing protein [Streptosporangiaceae bacterium NEAU-GS5]|nr:WD40 repeat domain-containing protein [Streptosporangiaceae bacterium NEAU-GS5]